MKTAGLTIRTPEGIAFSVQLAGPVTRFTAWLIDVAVISVLSKAAHSLTGVIGLISADFSRAALMITYVMISVGYGIAAEWYWRGQSIGKRVMQLRVMDERGLRLQFSQIVIRNLLRCVDNLPLCYMVGGLASLITRNAQRLGDVAANTIVIRIPEIRKPDFNQILPDKYNSFRNYPHLGARLRQRVSPQEAEIALESLLRRNELEPSARLELFRDLTSHFKALVPFPQEATDGISDEQYVKNVLEILFKG